MAPRDFCYSDDNAVCDELGPADHELCRFLRCDSVMRQGADLLVTVKSLSTFHRHCRNRMW